MIYDKIQRQYGRKFVNWIFKYYGIDDEIVDEKNPDVSRAGYNSLFPDFVGLSKHGYRAHMEFQTNKPKSEDLKRFKNYGLRTEVKTGEGVETYVFTRDPCEKNEYWVPLGPNNKYHIRAINHEDAETSKLLRSVEKKILSKIKLTEDELLFLKVGFITDLTDDTFELMLKVTDLVNKIETESPEEIDNMNIAHTIFSRNLLEAEEYKKVMEKIQMNDNIFLERFEAGKEECREQVAKNMLKDGVDVESIASWTGFTVDQIKKL